MEKYLVKLTEEERSLRQHLVSSGKAAARKLTHARILLLADASGRGPARADDDIQHAVGVGLATIHRARQRFVVESFEAALNPRPSPARPQKVKLQGDVERALLQLAGSAPPKGQRRWTLQLLADHLVVVGKVPSVSRETVRPSLKKTRSSRGCSKPGAFPLRRMRNSSTTGRTSCRRISGPTTPDSPSFAWTKRASS
jgi:hypothetical protein